ncbi:hypothetical protein JW921_00890 [Candidatus Fermentibacterales bacterium]|nr:hypothetical protein [Candidatus Fermentibacterales bacterium]
MVGLRGAGYPARALPVALALLVSSCHEVVEYGSVGSYGVCIIRTSDMAQVDCIEGFEGGRSLCSLGNSLFLVASTTGALFRVNSADRVVEEVYQIGPPFSAGYDEMTQVGVGQVYLVGGFGQLLEFGVPQGGLEDQFPAGPSPAALSRSTVPGRLYVADSYDCMIREVWTSDNTAYRELTLDGTPSGLAFFGWPAGYLAAVCSDLGVLYTVDVAGFVAQSIPLPGSCSDVAVLSDTSIYCVTHPAWSQSNGRVTLGDRFGLTPAMITLPAEGHPCCVCASPTTARFYVASVLEDGTSRVMEVDALLWGLTRSCEVGGYVRDITTHANGEYVLVLTSN